MNSLIARPGCLLSWLLLLLGPVGFAAPQPTVVSGHIEHPKGQVVVVALRIHPVTQQPQHPLLAQLDAAHNFRLEIPDLAFAQEAEFAHGGETADLYLTPGDELHLTLDTERFDETLTFTGRSASANNYLVQHYLRFEDFGDAVPPPPRSQAERDQEPAQRWRTPEQAQHRSDSLRQLELTFLRTYAARHPLPAEFERFARTAIIHSAAATDLWYPHLRRYIEKQPDQPAPAGFYERLRQLPSLDSAMRQNSSSWDLVVTCYLTAVLHNSPRPLVAAALPAQLTAHFGPTRTRDVVMARYCYYLLLSEDAEQAAPFVAALQQLTRDTLLLGPVQRAYEQKRRLIGAPAPDFTVRDAAGQAVRLSDFKGQVVYLDFWASWCGPCLLEMPASAKLREKFAGQDVVFLYVSVDTKEAAWKSALAKPVLHGPNARHAWAAGFDAPAPQAYAVQAIPAYFIIDRAGKLRKGTAPKPSAGQAVEDALTEALAK